MALRLVPRFSSILLLAFALVVWMENVTVLHALRVGTSNPRRHGQQPTTRRLVPRPWKQEPPPRRRRRQLWELRSAFVNGAAAAADNNTPASSLNTPNAYASQQQQQQVTMTQQLSQRLRPVALVMAGLTLIRAVPWQWLLAQYNNCMNVNPLLTKVVTGAVLAVVGDALAQQQSAANAEKYDARRAASFAAFDSCYRVFQHAAFPFIIAKCQGRLLGSVLQAVGIMSMSTTSSSSSLRHVLAVCERVFAYQMMVVPCLYYPVFFTFTGFMQGLTARQTFARAIHNFVPCWKRNLLFWIPIQAIMFGLVTENWQVPFVCVMGIVWSCILSVTAGKATNKEEEQQPGDASSSSK